jgi:hypothetical protein
MFCNELEQKLYQNFNDNPLLFGMYYCPHHFRKNSPAFHLKILKSAIKYKFLSIAAPRESAKSTMLSFLYPLHCICFKKKRFIIMVSNTFSKAAQSLETIKYEIKDNVKLKQHFNIEIIKDAEGNSIFKQNDFQTRVLCKGAEQIGSVRGEKFGAYRPDLVLVDDLEDDELVRNPDRRLALKEAYDQALIPAADKEFGQILVVGTILHYDSLMSNLVSKDYYPEYKKLFFKAKIEKDNKIFSLWPEKWSVDYLQYLEKEKPSVFAKEYQNDPVSGVLSKFNRSDFRYWQASSNNYTLLDEYNRPAYKGLLSDCKAAIACDLAWEIKRSNDFSVILSAFLTPQSDILIDSYICKKGLRPNEIEEILFSLEARLKSITGSSVPIGFEKAKLEKVMQWLLKKAMQKRNHFLIFKDLLWDADKITRIVTRLEPRYAQHSIYHKKSMGDLELQLLQIPDGAHDDLPDALQGVVQLLQYPKQEKKEEEKKDMLDWLKNNFVKKNNSLYEKLKTNRKTNNKINNVDAIQGF